MSSSHESDELKQNAAVFDENMSRLLTRAYDPEAPSASFVEQALDQMLVRARGEAANRRRSWLQRWTSSLGGRAALLAAALAVAGVVTLGYAIRQKLDVSGRQGTLFAATNTESTLATLASAVDAQWSIPLEESAPLGPGVLQLQKGVAQLVFSKGAVLTLEGPVELELVNSERCRLIHGSVTASVPPDAIGFTVTTSNMRIVDLGTAFGVRVGPDIKTEVHVFDGEVNLFDDGSETNHLTHLLGGQGIRVVDGLPVSIDANPTSFVTNDDVAKRLEERRRRAFANWLEYSEKWNADPAVVLRYDFNETSAGAFHNTVDPQSHRATAVNSMPRLVAGRWPGKRAMVFDGRTDLLTVDDHEDLRLQNDFSLAVWLRQTGHPYNGWTRLVGKGVGTLRNYGLWAPENDRMVWQICPAGKFEWWDTELATRPLELNRWHLLVGILADDMSKFYVDGKLEVARAIERPIATSSDPLTIGYYSDIPAHEGHFSGELDELILLNRALSADEIETMYSVGKPL